MAGMLDARGCFSVNNTEVYSVALTWSLYNTVVERVLKYTAQPATKMPYS